MIYSDKTKWLYIQCARGGSRAPGSVGEKDYTPLYSAASHASTHSFVGFSGLQGQVQDRSTHKEASVCNRLKQQLTDSSFQVSQVSDE